MGNPYDPYGQQQPGYGQQQPGYGQPPAQPGYGQPPAQPGYQEVHHHHYGSTGQLAEWGSRAGATLIDGLIIGAPLMVLYLVGALLAAAGDAAAVLGGLIILLGYLVAFAVSIWMIYQEGTTGQTIGKRQMGIRLISAQTGQPLGFGMAFVRRIAHVADSFACYIGYLWPLWDERKQTFADKICNTVVVRS